MVVADVRLLLGDAAAAEFEELILQCHVEADPTLRRCTSPNCSRIITPDAIGLCHVATCECGQRICWRCRGEAHAPLSCEYLDQWLKITKAESLQAKWICENTKPCPKCARRIEKNGGCNHMTCRTANGNGCGYEFCWVCGHEWHTHVGNGYQCNKFTDFDASKPGDLPEYDLKRLNHYHTRYMNHMQSHDAELAAREQFRTAMYTAWGQIDSDIFRGKVQAPVIIQQVFEAIDTARSILIWSYPHAFYMKPGSTELKLFEHVQTEVERYLEELTHAVEHQVFMSPLHFEKLAKIVLNNSDVLNKHVDQYSR
jgi:ariadne-1